MEIESCLLEGLYVLKALYDHGKHQETLEEYRNQEMCGDDYFEIALTAISRVFEKTREYYNEEADLNVYVFFDPVITEFYSLCARYEKERGIDEKDNPIRTAMENALASCLYFDSYAYDYRIYGNPEKPGGCRLVLLLCCEFYCYFEVVPGLLDAYEAYRNNVRRLKEELGLIPKSVSLEAMSELKEAA